jgi:hypothetical protein
MRSRRHQWIVAVENDMRVICHADSSKQPAQVSGMGQLGPEPAARRGDLVIPYICSARDMPKAEVVIGMNDVDHNRPGVRDVVR